MRSRVAYFVILVVAVLLSSAGAWAVAGGDGAEGRLTLADALRLAHEHNLSLRSIRQEVSIAAGQVEEARSSALPQLDGVAEYTRFDDVATIGDLTLGQKDHYEISANVSQVLYAGGGIRAALRLAQSYEKAAEANAAEAEEKTAYAVHARFNQVLLAQETLKVCEQALSLAKKNRGDVALRLEQGTAKRLDLLRADAQVSRAEADLIAARATAHTAHLGLLREIGLPLTNRSDVVGSLTVAADMDSLARSASRLALSRRHDLVAASRTVDMQREALAVARSGRRPTVSLSGQLKRGNPDRSYADEWENSWYAGVRAEWSLFDGRQTRGKVAQAAARLRRAELQLGDAESKAQLEIAQAEAELAAAERLVEARGLNVEQATEAERLARRAYIEGVETQVDVIAAQTALTESRYQFVAAQFEHTMAYRRLQLATGTLIQTDTMQESE